MCACSSGSRLISVRSFHPNEVYTDDIRDRLYFEVGTYVIICACALSCYLETAIPETR